MLEVVKRFIETKNYELVKTLQKQILDDYFADFSNMSREVKQVVETSNEAGNTGTITVITQDDSGREYASTREYDYWTSKAEATEKATQDSLNK